MTEKKTINRGRLRPSRSSPAFNTVKIAWVAGLGHTHRALGRVPAPEERAHLLEHVRDALVRHLDARVVLLDDVRCDALREEVPVGDKHGTSNTEGVSNDALHLLTLFERFGSVLVCVFISVVLEGV